jgi:hypothetical protein
MHAYYKEIVVILIILSGNQRWISSSCKSFKPLKYIVRSLISDSAYV